MNDDLENTTSVEPEVEQDDFDKDLPKDNQASHKCEVRKRIEELLERKRLKELLDDSDDWDI